MTWLKTQVVSKKSFAIPSRNLSSTLPPHFSTRSVVRKTQASHLIKLKLRKTTSNLADNLQESQSKLKSNVLFSQVQQLRSLALTTFNHRMMMQPNGPRQSSKDVRMNTLNMQQKRCAGMKFLQLRFKAVKLKWTHCFHILSVDHHCTRNRLTLLVRRFHQFSIRHSLVSRRCSYP